MLSQIQRDTRMASGIVRKQRQAGFTMVDGLIGLTLTAVIIGAAVTVTNTTASSTRTTVAQSRVTQQAHRILDKLSKELLGAGAHTISPSPLPDGASTMTFRKAIGWNAGMITWSEDRRLQLIDSPDDPVDGVDNDDDGVIDDQQLILTVDVGTPDETSVVLADPINRLVFSEDSNGVDDNGNGLVDEPGVCFQLQGEVLTIRITLSLSDDSGAQYSQSVECSVHLRNSEG